MCQGREWYQIQKGQTSHSCLLAFILEAHFNLKAARNESKHYKTSFLGITRSTCLHDVSWLIRVGWSFPLQCLVSLWGVEWFKSYLWQIDVHILKSEFSSLVRWMKNSKNEYCEIIWIIDENLTEQRALAGCRALISCQFMSCFTLPNPDSTQGLIDHSTDLRLMRRKLWWVKGLNPASHSYFAIIYTWQQERTRLYRSENQCRMKQQRKGGL